MLPTVFLKLFLLFKIQLQWAIKRFSWVDCLIVLLNFYRGNLYCNLILSNTWFSCFHAINCYSSVSHLFYVPVLSPIITVIYSLVAFILLHHPFHASTSMLLTLSYLFLTYIDITLSYVKSYRPYYHFLLFVSCSSLLWLG